jgi:two-component system phosphate regulon sensor histidine kinase PhoR
MDTTLIVGLAAAALTLGLLWRREAAAAQRLQRQARQASSDTVARLTTARERLAWLEAAGAVSDDLLLVCDRALALRYLNPAARERFGDQDPQASLIAYTGSLELEQLAQDALEAPTAGLERMIYLEDRPFQARASASEGGVALALSDVAELERLARARQDFVANLSHELRTPLTSLRLLVDTLIAQSGKRQPLIRDLAGKMAVEVDTMHQMAQEMLDLAAIEAGRQVVRLVPTPMQSTVDQAVARLADQAERKQIQISREVSPDLLILADAELAGRAVLNVLHNAIRFTPESGQIRIVGRGPDPEGMLLLSIEDSGPGIPPGDLERIFERFYRGQQPVKSAGTGLGLAIARHVLKAHGGRIWAENRRPPQRGAVFHLSFLAA